MKKLNERILRIFCVLLIGMAIGPVSRFSMAAPPAHPSGQREIGIEDVINRLDGWLGTAFGGYQFNNWIKLGDLNQARARFSEGDVQVYIDPDFLDSIEANASYVDYSALGLGYFNDLVLADIPANVPAQTIWHEVMHAIFDAHDSELLVDNDEMYTWYMENVILHALPWLEQYEEELAKGEACDQKLLDQKWDKFVEKMQGARNTGYGTITSDAQIEQLRQLTGFQVNVDTIRQGYVAAGLDKCPSAATPPAVTSASLDLIFCIDVTGSMEDDIASVKAAASNIVNAIAAKNEDYRVAIVAYRDWDDSMGYAMFEDYSFSTDKAAIIANINSLSVGGGDDTPEAVFEALMRAIDSTAVGGWRYNVNKQVILMGDAPPHNPSREGLTAPQVAKAAEEADPVVIQAIVVANDGVYNSEAVDAFRELAELTAGNFFEADDASQVPEMLQKSIEVIEPPPGTGSLLPNLGTLLAGALCLLLFVLVGVLLFVVIFWRRRRRRRVPPRAPAAVPPPTAAPVRQSYVAPPPPAPAPWQGETVASPSAVMAELVVEEGPDAGRRFSLKLNTRLGRAPDNDIVLQDVEVSRHHAAINFTGAVYVIADLGSANGTKVNGVPIDQPRQLRHGDVIVVGTEQLLFYLK
ncbi:MAG: FHA domain-containing protein [Chloroflexota bacterium]|nr:FHA domain-containing protein [Chloroflexota bacterium]